MSQSRQKEINPEPLKAKLLKASFNIFKIERNHFLPDPKPLVTQVLECVNDFGIQVKMTWTADDIKVELVSTAKLLQARPGVFDLEQKLTKVLLRKMDLLTTSNSSDLVKLYEAVKEVNLPETMSKELIGQLDKMAVCDIDELSLRVGSVNGQCCKHFHKYLTATDIATLEKSSMYEGAYCLAQRMRQLGIKGMKETLKRAATGLLVWHERQRTGKLPSPDTAYDLCGHLMSQLVSCGTPIPEHALCLAKYPDDPMTLSAGFYGFSISFFSLRLADI